MDEPRLTKTIAEISRDHVLEIAKAICRVGQPEGREGPRAEVVAGFLDHPRIDLLLDPVLPGRPNVIARVRGTGAGPGLLLNGHLDAGYAPNWSRDPHDPWITGNRLYGAGLSDMLGGLASMIATVAAAARLDPLPGDLVLLANMHHDSNGLGTKYALAGGDSWPGFGINGEPTSLTCMTAHGGCIKFEVTFAGKTAHVSRMEHGVDALAAAIDTHARLRQLQFAHQPHPLLPGLPKCVVGVLQAGAAPAAVAETATLRGDLRTVPGMTWDTVRQDLAGVVARSCPAGVTARIGCLVRQRPFIGPGSGALIDALARAHRAVRGDALRTNVDRGAQAFVTDAVDMAAAGIESVVYGPAEWHYAPDAFIDIDEMADAARVYLTAAICLMQEERRG